MPIPWTQPILAFDTLSSPTKIKTERPNKPTAPENTRPAHLRTCINGTRRPALHLRHSFSSFSRVTSASSPHPLWGRLRVLLLRHAVWPFSWILRLSYSVAPLPYHTRRILSTSGGHLFSHSGISVCRALFFVQSALKRGILPGSRLCFPPFKFFIDKFPRI